MSARSQLILLLVLVPAIPLLAWASRPYLAPRKPEPDIFSGGKAYPPSELAFTKQAIGPEPTGLPLITNVQVVDEDGDGQNEILVCDASLNQITVYRRQGEEWNEEVLIPLVSAPAHVTPVDADGDGDLDMVVSVLGNIMPDDSVIGRVELFERTDSGFERHVILDNVRRIADVQPGDFDQDGDIDFAVAEFGYSRGAVRWLQNEGDFQYRDHELLNAPGTIHVPVADYDGDGDLDIAAIVSQDEEELWAFENAGDGTFTPRRLWFTINLDLGSAGLVSADLDSDGDQDLILPAGDNLEDFDAYPQPYHGCYWFENKGDWTFEMKRISDLGGTYAAAAGDLDGDNDIDVALVSMTNDWYTPGTASVVWLENDGEQNFTSWQIASDPIHLVTVAIGDINGDSRLDVLAGALNFRKPYERVGRVSAWLGQQKGGAK